MLIVYVLKEVVMILVLIYKLVMNVIHVINVINILIVFKMVIESCVLIMVINY